MKDKSVVLFTIPVYALSKERLHDKVDKEIDKVIRLAKGLDDDTQRRLIDHCTFPYRCWKYNHIIAYIEIFANLNDVYFNLYLPYEKKKYYWKSTKKTLLVNVGFDHDHFRVYDEDSNELIIEKIRLRLKDKERMFPKNWYIDYESFELYAKYLDIRTILQEYREEASD